MSAMSLTSRGISNVPTCAEGMVHMAANTTAY
jgi:hypothetical protein